MRESLQLLRPTLPAPGTWLVLSTHIEGQLKRFNTPNADNVARLLSDCLGLANVRAFWTWRNYTAPQAIAKLAQAMTERHEIAHGVNPRPPILKHYSAALPAFFRRLARCSDDAVRNHLVTAHGVAAPWPA